MKQEARTYHLSDAVRIFFSDPEEIRFRKGIWSYTEAVLQLQGQEETAKAFFTAVAEQLIAEGYANVAGLASKLDLSEADVLAYCEILERIRAQGFLADSPNDSASDAVSAIFGDTVPGYEAYVSAPRPVLFVADTDYAKNVARTIANQMDLPLDVMHDEVYGRLLEANLTDKTDAIAHEALMGNFRNLVSSYSCIAASFSKPKVSFLRNLNRLLLDQKKPLILGLIDGPFLSVLSTVVPQTGCFECFEQRLLARLEDTAVYHSFVKAQQRFGERRGNDHRLAPSVHMMTAAVLAESLLFSTMNMCRLAGRCVNIYLPLLEVQVEDLLRVAYCPACGYVSESKMDEMYTSSREVVNRMLKNIELDK
jgi:thiazole/oxazole-forming peptide maturase SagC family component